MLPKNVKTRQRSFGFLDYRPGEEVSMSLTTGALLLETWIRVKYTITNSLTPPADGLLGGVERIINRFEIEVADQDKVVSLDGMGLALQCQHDYGILPDGHVALPSTANAATTVEIYIPIAHWLPKSQNPLLTGIDLRYVQSAAMRLRWADGVDAFGTDNGATISDVTCEIIGTQFDGLGDDVASPFVRELGYQRHFIKQADDRFTIQIEKRTGRLIRSINLLTTRDQKASGASAANPVLTGDIRVMSGGDMFASVPARFLAARQRMLDGLEPNDASYPIVFSNYGDPGQMIDSNSLQSALIVECEVDGPQGGETASEITAVTEYVRPLRVA